MNLESVTNSFAPGDYVFLQGEKSSDYYKVLSGRFAKVRSNVSVHSVGVRQMLANAELINIISHQELIGEIEALMGYPLPFSVFALDESEVFSIPASDHQNMQVTFHQNPHIGVKTCISFAKYLKQFFDYFSKLAVEDAYMDSFTRSTARDYLAVINELETISNNRECPELAAAKQHKAYEVAQRINSQPGLSAKGSSVACGVVPFAGRQIKLQKFRAGTLLCKKGTIGDSLFITTEGSAEVVVEGHGKNIPIDRPGSVIGEIAVFLNLASPVPDTRRTADVVCTTDLSAIVLKIDQIEEFFSRQPEIMTRILLEMVSRSENTRNRCLETEKHLNSMLYARLGVVLEGLNSLAHSLKNSPNGSLYSRPLTFCAQRARAVFDRFRETLSLLEKKKKIHT